MAIAFMTTSQVADQYLANLKSLKPQLDTSKADNDWNIRAQVTGGVLAGVYSDQRKVGEDCFPQSARRDALLADLFTYFGEVDFRPATQAQGSVRFTGTNGSTIPVGQTATYVPTGAVYTFQNATPDVISGTSGTEVIKSVSVGQAQNLLTGATLTLNSPPAGVNATITVLAPGIGDGKDQESEPEAAARILDFIQSGSPGGNAADYRAWAFDGDATVSTVNVLRFFFGFGTVAICITAGTTDFDVAIDQGQPISVIPSSGTIAAVQTFIDGIAPETDCPTVIGCITQSVSVNVAAKFLTGLAATLVANPNIPGALISQGQLMANEVSRAIYKTGVGGVVLPGGTQGYVLAKDIQDGIDSHLGAGPAVVGSVLQTVKDRVVTIVGGSPNVAVAANAMPIPGSIVVSDE